jgi:hypothetical protein
MKTPNVNELNWKQFVVACCRLGVENTSGEIAEVISRNEGITVTKGQVAAVKACYTMGRYN